MKFINGLANSDHFSEESFASIRSVLEVDGLSTERFSFDLGASKLARMRAEDFSAEDARVYADTLRNFPLVITLYGNDYVELVGESIKIAKTAKCDVQAYLNGVGVGVEPQDSLESVATRFLAWMEVQQADIESGIVPLTEHRSLTIEAALSFLAAAQLFHKPIAVQLKETEVIVTPDWTLKDLVQIIGLREGPRLRGCLGILGELGEEVK